MKRSVSKLKFLLFAFLISGATDARATGPLIAGPSGQALNFGIVKRLIQQNGVTSVEQLIPLLPESYRRNFTMMYESKSSQGASAENPRVIMFGETAQSVLAFNGSPSHRGFNSFEMVDFNQETNEFEFHQIDFSESAPKFSEMNPKACVGCHKGSEQDLRPNWDRYPFWPGAFGSVDDVPDKHGEEANWLSRFRRTMKASARYKHLLFGDSSAAPYDSALKGHLRDRPNARLTMLLSRWNAKRVLGLMKLRPNFALYRDFILADPSRGKDRSAFAELAEKSALFSSANIERIRSTQDGMLQIVSDQLRLTPADWSLQFGAKEYGQKSPFPREGFHFTYYDGFNWIPTYVENELWKDLAADDEIVRSTYLEKPVLNRTYDEGARKYEQGALIDRLGGTAFPYLGADARVKVLLESAVAQIAHARSAGACFNIVR